MRCEKVLDKVYESRELPLLDRIGIGLHLLACPDCAQEVERFEVCRDILQNEFMPSAPDMEEPVMAKVACEGGDAEIPGGFSTKSWVAAGLAMLVSLATAFFGLDFNKVAGEAGMAFMIPIGITIGIALTCYGAIFIGSHLKELSRRFGLE